MKVGDLVRFRDPDLLSRWTAYGLVCEVCAESFNVDVLWPEEGMMLIDNRFLELVNESR